jgi:uncharacterized protein (TIGR02300 family)
MKKAAQKTKGVAAKASPSSAPATLGTKRQCPKCTTKFYDFGKTELTCPKCKTEFDVKTLAMTSLKNLVDKKAHRAPARAQEDDAEEGATPAAGEFESLEDLSDDADVEEIVEADADKEEDY